MQYSQISRVLGRYFLYCAGVLLLPLGVSLLYEFLLERAIYPNFPNTFAFLETIAICLLLSYFLSYFGRRAKKEPLRRKESILLVILVWLLTAGIGASPFLFSRTLTNPIDAYFESMSGLTTTGATVIQAKAYDAHTKEEIPIRFKNPIDPAISYSFYGTVAPLLDPKTGTVLREGVEALGKPLLFWRSFLQWFGGIGIIVLFISVLPALGMGGKFLYESEVSGPTKEGIRPRIRETAVFLWKIYIGLTVLQIALLIFSDPKIPFFDAVTLSFATLSTGGFTVHNDGLASYPLGSIGWVIGLFMILGGLNFSLYFHCLKRKIYRLNDVEFFSYLAILLMGCLCLSAILWYTSSFSFKLTALQAISAQTSTGYAFINYDYWPLTSQFLLLMLMFIGGMSGSTAGGIKVIRVVTIFRVISNKIESFFRPGVVRVLKVGNKEITDKTAMTTLTFFCILIFLLGFGVFLLLLDGIDPLTSLGVVSTTLTNSGLYFGGIGSMESLGFLSNFSKIVGILWMLLGRLEFFSLFILFSPSFWRD